MMRTHPNQSLDTLVSLIILSSIWRFCGLPLHPGSSESRKTLEQEFFFRIGTLNLKEAPLWVPRHTTLIAQRIFYLAAHALVILFVGLMDQRYEPKMHAIRLLLDSDLVAYASYSHWQRQQLMFSLCTVVICDGRFLFLPLT